jgi:hypothetical protein
MTDDEIREMALRGLAVRGVDIERLDITEPRGESGVAILVETTSGRTGMYYVEIPSGEMFNMPSATGTASRFEQLRRRLQRD